MVLVVPMASLAAAVADRGLVTDEAGWRAMAGARFVARGPAEEDESLRQVIPYVVLRDRGALFTYARNRAGREQRLHDLRSIGVGGHVNPGDVPADLKGFGSAPRPLLAAAARRELDEELRGLPGDSALEWRGFILDEEAAVSRVHLGVVFVTDVDPTAVHLSDEGRMADGRFVLIEELASDAAAYEGWSRLVIGHFAGRA